MRSHYRGYLSEQISEFTANRFKQTIGLVMIAASAGLSVALMTWSARDPSLNHATNTPVRNLLGAPGAIIADVVMQLIGFGAIAAILPLAIQGMRLIRLRRGGRNFWNFGLWALGVMATAATAALLPASDRWPLPTGLGGVVGDGLLALPRMIFGDASIAMAIFGVACALIAILAVSGSAGLGAREEPDISDDTLIAEEEKQQTYDDEDMEGEPGFALISVGALIHAALATKSWMKRTAQKVKGLNKKTTQKTQTASARKEPSFEDFESYASFAPRQARNLDEVADTEEEAPIAAPRRKQRQPSRSAQPKSSEIYDKPPLTLLAEPKKNQGGARISEEMLEENARLLEGVLDDFSVRGEIINSRPGPVVTLYELEPAAGVKSSRVIGLADDIARSMSAISARVAVVSGRNAIGIELPNQRRETVYLKELIGSEEFSHSSHKLAIALGKTIGGEPVIVDLARMPHLLVAGTTGSGKSVAINTMILSLLYRLKPEECRLIMVDPKMLELSVYDNIPHLLTPVVTDPKKAVVALKWAVREMEDRYRKMSKLGVRNIDGFNARVSDALTKGETITRTVQTGFDRETGEAIFEHEAMALTKLPYIVVIVDEMADLMLVAGKDIEGAIQRLAQMARAAGIHLIMATQRPSVDVITGTIKANFPTRISFQVTSKIDSRTILGEQGAEQLLGQGDMLYMAGGGRISRVHGPFVSDAEVEKIVDHLKLQGMPQYLDAITTEDDANDNEMSAAPGSMDAEEGGDLYDRAVNIVLRDRKCSTSYIQRRLSVGYNKAASLVERMEQEGVVSQANHAGKREILVGGGVDRGAFDIEAAE